MENKNKNTELFTEALIESLQKLKNKREVLGQMEFIKHLIMLDFNENLMPKIHKVKKSKGGKNGR